MPLNHNRNTADTDHDRVMGELRHIRGAVDEISLVIMGDGKKEIGVVGEVRKLKWQVKFAVSIASVVFSSLCYAWSGHAFEPPAAAPAAATQPSR